MLLKYIFTTLTTTLLLTGCGKETNDTKVGTKVESKTGGLEQNRF
ncbi:hypothetical protein [Macrococcus animalis]